MDSDVSTLVSRSSTRPDDFFGRIIQRLNAADDRFEDEMSLVAVLSVDSNGRSLAGSSSTEAGNHYCAIKLTRTGDTVSAEIMESMGNATNHEALVRAGLQRLCEDQGLKVGSIQCVKWLQQSHAFECGIYAISAMETLAGISDADKKLKVLPTNHRDPQKMALAENSACSAIHAYSSQLEGSDKDKPSQWKLFTAHSQHERHVAQSSTGAAPV